ncbi:hypothetical protein [Kosakonia cowanii]|uniref:hypothetical protein n=1 Tax=Kosakonia cowanii TaxID=208223 RepID=UPI0040639DEB
MYKVLNRVLNTFMNYGTPGDPQEEEEVQPYKAVRNAKEIVRGIFAFEDMTKGGRRLTIQGHGYIINNKGVMVDAKHDYYDGKELKKLLVESGINLTRYKKVRLVCCRSADSGSPLAQQIANEFNLPTKGYSGSAWGNVRNSMLRAWINGYDQFTEPQAKIFAGENNYMHKGVSWRIEGGRKKLIENMSFKFKPQVADIIEDSPGAILNSGAGVR